MVSSEPRGVIHKSEMITCLHPRLTVRIKVESTEHLARGKGRLERFPPSPLPPLLWAWAYLMPTGGPLGAEWREPCETQEGFSGEVIFELALEGRGRMDLEEKTERNIPD